MYEQQSVDYVRYQSSRAFSLSLQPLAPPLHDHLQFHAFFLYHHNDRDWVLNVMERLESPMLGFRCCCHERDFDFRASYRQTVHYGLKHAAKTVIVLSPDFVTNTWCQSDCQLLSEMDILLVQKDLITVLLQECDAPESLNDVRCIDAAQEDWWGRLLAHLVSTGRCCHLEHY